VFCILFIKKYFIIFHQSKKIKDWRSHHAAAMPAVKQSGQHKNKSCLHTAVRSVGCLRHGLAKKIIRRACWLSIIFFDIAVLAI
jgi:hypothetical protein